MIEADTIHALAAIWGDDGDPSPECIATTLSSYRSLRNACAGSVEFQSACCADGTLIEDTYNILQVVLKSDKEDYLLCARVITQFLGNLIVNHNDNQLLVWEKFSPTLKHILTLKDAKLTNICSMVIYNILLGQPDLRAPKPHGTDLLVAFLHFVVMESEFAVYATELFISTPDVLVESYPLLNIECRLRLLEICHNMLLTMPDCSTKIEDKKKKELTKIDMTNKIPISSIKFMVEQLKRRSFLILKTSAHYADSLEPREVSKLIEVVACASSKDPYTTELQTDKSLLIDCTFLLKSIHMAGQAGDPDFSAISNLSKLTITEKGIEEKLEQHPTFGFKACLVRLIGNLCWRNHENQDQVRELDGIPLILDCCSIDARNPLMLQWVVLAVHNLCENNKENQAVIARMSHEGAVDSRMLHDLGYALHTDEKSNKVRIVPLKSK